MESSFSPFQVYPHRERQQACAAVFLVRAVAVIAAGDLRWLLSAKLDGVHLDYAVDAEGLDDVTERSDVGENGGSGAVHADHLTREFSAIATCQVSPRAAPACPHQRIKRLS